MFLLTVSLFVSLPKTFQKQLQILPTSYQNQPKITTKVIRFSFEKQSESIPEIIKKSLKNDLKST